MNHETNSTSPLPALKAGIEAVEIDHEGKPMVLLRDQEGLNENAVAVSLSGFLLAMMLNGQNTITDVQALFAKNTGAVLTPDEIKGMVGQLEKSDLLETEAVRNKRRQVIENFRLSPTRKPAHIRSGYP